MSSPTPSDRIDLSTSNTSSDPDKTSSSESVEEYDRFSLIRVTKAEARFFFPSLPERCIIPDGSTEPSRGFVGLVGSWSDVC
jgi:hypothetical protein